MIAPWICLAISDAGLSVAGECSAASFNVTLRGIQLLSPDELVETNTTAARCLSQCCRRHSCVAWNIQVSSEDPTHHPGECWIATTPTLRGRPAAKTDVWEGGSKVALSPVTPADGAVIQPVSRWFYHGAGLSDTLALELTDQSIARLKERAADVANLKSRDEWEARVRSTRAKLSSIFAPLPPASRSPPKFTVVKTLHRTNYTCELVKYETRPGFFATGAIWSPKSLRNRGKAPGILLVSGQCVDLDPHRCCPNPLRPSAFLMLLVCART